MQTPEKTYFGHFLTGGRRTLQPLNGKITKAQMSRVLSVSLSDLGRNCNANRITVDEDGFIDLSGNETLIYIRNRYLKTYRDVRKPSQRQITAAFRHFGLTKKRIAELEKERFEKKIRIEKSKGMDDLRDEERRHRIEKLKKEIEMKEIEIGREKGELVKRDGLSKICFSYLDLLNRNLFRMHKRHIDYLHSLFESKKTGFRQTGIKYLDNEIAKSVKKTQKELTKVLNEM